MSPLPLDQKRRHALYWRAKRANLVVQLARFFYIYIIGERERANLVVQLTRFFCIILYIYILFLSGEATYRITLYVLLNQRGLRTSSISAPQLPEIADSTGKNRIFLPIPETSHFPPTTLLTFLSVPYYTHGFRESCSHYGKRGWDYPINS